MGIFDFFKKTNTNEAVISENENFVQDNNGKIENQEFINVITENEFINYENAFNYNSVKGKDIDITKCKKNETKFYHEIYGEGIYHEYEEQNKYIFIKFDNSEQILRFSWDKSINKDIYLEKTEKMKMRDESLKSSFYKAEYEKEQKHFNEIYNYVQEKYKEAKKIEDETAF